MSVVTATYRFTGVGEDFGPRSDGMVTLHTTEPADPLKTTVRDALALARWQDRDDTVGSYNRLICTDGVVSTVADNHASGGINPGSPFFQPRAWLYTVLDRDEVNNPNYFTANLSAMGRRAYFDANGWPDKIIDGFARSIIEEEDRIGRKVVITQHADFQPGNRSDAGDIATNLVKARYSQLTGGDVIVKTPIRRAEWWTKIGPASTFTRSDGTQGHFTARERVTSIADLTLDDGTRGLLLCYGEKHEALVISRGGMDGPPISETLGCGSGSDATCQAELASAKQTIEAQTDIIAEQKTRITAAKVALG